MLSGTYIWRFNKPPSLDVIISAHCTPLQKRYATLMLAKTREPGVMEKQSVIGLCGAMMYSSCLLVTAVMLTGS